MRSMLAACCLFAIGAISGGASVHTAYTAKSVSYIQPEGERLYSATERRDLKRMITAELRKAKMYPGR